MVFGIDGFTFLGSERLFVPVGGRGRAGWSVPIPPVPADNLGLNRRNYLRDRRNEWLCWRQCGLGWGLLTHVGNFKPISLGQGILSEASTDCRFVDLSF